jgi:methanogenic corrinoid protein MtbC1
MPFVRLKRRRGRAYGYLVENRWDPKAGQPRQRVLRYLGPAEQIRIADLPRAVRTTALAGRLQRAAESADVRRAATVDELRYAFREALVAGDFPRARGAALRAVREVGVGGLYGEVIPEVFAEIGRRWAAGSLSVSREHLASAVAARVVEQVNARYRLPMPARPEVVLCVPEGETHTLGLQLAEGLLRQKGFAPLNIGASAPSASTLAFVVERRPVAALISVTLPDLLGAARTLALQIRRRLPGVQVVVGGQGVPPNPPRAADEQLEYVSETLPTFFERWAPGTLGPSKRAASVP